MTKGGQGGMVISSEKWEIYYQKKESKLYFYVMCVCIEVSGHFCFFTIVIVARQGLVLELVLKNMVVIFRCEAFQLSYHHLIKFFPLYIKNELYETGLASVKGR